MSDWKKDLKKESIENALKAGDINPLLTIGLNESRKVEILCEPFQPEGRDFYVMDVKDKGDNDATKSMYVSKSLRFHMAVIEKKHNLETIVGQEIIIGKKLADMSDKGFSKETEVYWAQLAV